MKTREILFRGKRKDNSQWAYGDLVNCQNRGIYIYVPNTEYADEMDSRKDGSSYSVPDEVTSKYEADPKTVGQFTGLTDKNGKKIFEGDITKALEVVIFENGAFKTTYKDDTQSGNQLTEKRCKFIRIIGNVYDNPTLLK